jgi:hypothetical protein
MSASNFPYWKFSEARSLISRRFGQSAGTSFAMKTKARKIVAKPPGPLEVALDKLQLTYGPLALDTAMRNRLRPRGRRPERSVKTKLMVWSLVEEWSRRHKKPIFATCHFAASH